MVTRFGVVLAVFGSSRTGEMVLDNKELGRGGLGHTRDADQFASTVRDLEWDIVDQNLVAS